uniref:Uncharacterized protein n=1 Tax=Russula griseocarnosa TaxID=466936 RepID=A0A650AWG7_9AGAM|nr:hypothetical protein [Russula griseocarnosa]
MTTEHSTIAICVLAVIAIPLGTFIGISAFKKCTRVPINTLHRSGDIELQYIEPSRPEQIYNRLDLEDQFSYYDRITSWPPSYNTGPILSYRSGTIPSYYTQDRFYINSCLENENITNLYLWFVLVLSIINFFNKYNNSNYSFIIFKLFLILLGFS